MELPNLSNGEKRGLLARDGQGEYSSRVFAGLLKKGLVDDNFYLTDAGLAARKAIWGR